MISNKCDKFVKHTISYIFISFIIVFRNEPMKKLKMLSIAELERLSVQPFTCFHKIRQALHVTLHPRYLNNLELGLLDYFNKQINRWHPKLNGILANYGKLKLRSPHGTLLNEEAHIHLDVVSDFWVFRPEIGSILQGTVSKTSQKHVACLVHGVFNVPCYHPNNLGSTPWWGINAVIGNEVRFKVIKMDISQKIPFILGELEKWGLDGKQVTLGGSVLEKQVEEVEPERWEQFTGGNESQGEHSDADSGIQSLPNKIKQDVVQSTIPLNLLPLTPIAPETIVSKAEVTKSPTKTPKGKGKKNSKAATSTEKNVVASPATGNKLDITPRPPNIDDLIKSIQVPVQPITLPTTPVPTSKTNGSEATPKKKAAPGEVIKRQCSFCDNVMPKKGLKNHVISAHFKDQLIAKIPSCAPGKTGPYQCPKCEKSQKDRTDILRHFANAHNELVEFCSESQLQGREVPDAGGPKDPELPKSSNISSPPAVPIQKEVDEIPVTEEKVSSKKRKKEKKNKNLSQVESSPQPNTNASTLGDTNCTPIRSSAHQEKIADDTPAMTIASSKKKKKKNKEKDKEKDISELNGKGVKRERENESIEMPSAKKSKAMLEASDVNENINEVSHKKKKKKKDKKKNE